MNSDESNLLDSNAFAHDKGCAILEMRVERPVARCDGVVPFRSQMQTQRRATQLELPSPKICRVRH